MQSLKLNLQQCSDKYHFVVIGIVLLAISLYINLIFVFFLLYSYFIIKRKYLNKILIIICFILSLLLIIFFYFYNYVPSYLNTNIYVSEVKENYFTFYVGFNKYLSYDKIGVKPGDILYIEGSVNEYLEPSYDGDFNTITFLRGKLVKGIYHIDYYEIKSYILTFTRLKCLILEYYQSKISSDYFDLFSCLVFGENVALDTTNYAKLNILHVLALSGFHLILIYKFLFSFLFKITKKYVLSENIVLVLLFFYTALCGFQVSLNRSLIFLIISKFNERYNVRLAKLDLFSITFLVELINPLIIYNTGFIFSQISSFGLLYINEFINAKNKIIKQLLEGIYFLALCFPFMTNFTNELSFFTIISFLFTNIISVIFIPLCFIFLIIPNLSYYLSFLLIGFNSNLTILANSLTFITPYMNNYIKIFYYIGLIYILFLISSKKRVIKGFFLFICIILLYLFIPNITNNYIVFLDCSQGDSCLIKANYKYYMIDCYNSYDYLKKKGIKEIEAIFISHADSDHFGDLSLIANDIDVKMVYYSATDNEIRTKLEDINVKSKALNYDDIIEYPNLVFDILSGRKEYDSLNDNSLVILISFLNKKFLFTGDISIEVELDLLPCLSDIDVLKVAHHGSDTSTSIDFLTKTKPEIAIISCGYNNRYNFPSDSTIKKLKNLTTYYITYETGNIIFYHNKIKTYH